MGCDVLNPSVRAEMRAALLVGSEAAGPIAGDCAAAVWTPQTPIAVRTIATSAAATKNVLFIAVLLLNGIEW